ncbi:alpha/beta fold hydrolase [Nocardia sp. NPDC127526]|uniref:alpha/beta fold hydrolase n=1 Tax=Nocardia sp. NPDC127526 TaxID=3345393 RepID=UPI0036284F49
MTQDSHLPRAGARIAYRLSGSGSPLAYAHGILLSRAAVRRLELFDFDRLAAEHHLLTYDQRGHGHSAGRPVAEDYRFENIAQDLLALMDEISFTEPLDMVGSSLGCAAALYAALAAPDRFRRLVLMIPPAAWDDGLAARQWYLDTADQIDTLGAPAWLEHWEAADPLPIFADHPQFHFTPDVPNELLAPALRGAGSSDLPPQPDVARLPHRTLILTWDTDPLHPTSTAQRLAELLPNSSLHVAKSVDDIRTWTTMVAEFCR